MQSLRVILAENWYITNKFTVVRPLHRVNVDLTHGMLRELDERAARLNVSRQAVIKTLLRQALNEGREPAGVEEEGRLMRRGCPANSRCWC